MNKTLKLTQDVRQLLELPSIQETTHPLLLKKVDELCSKAAHLAGMVDVYKVLTRNLTDIVGKTTGEDVGSPPK